MNDHFGSSLAISGGNDNNCSNSGSVYVFCDFSTTTATTTWPKTRKKVQQQQTNVQFKNLKQVLMEIQRSLLQLLMFFLVVFLYLHYYSEEKQNNHKKKHN